MIGNLPPGLIMIVGALFLPLLARASSSLRRTRLLPSPA